MVITAMPMMASASTDEGVEWWNFRNNEENNGVTDRELPETSNEAALKWAVKPMYGGSKKTRIYFKQVCCDH